MWNKQLTPPNRKMHAVLSLLFCFAVVYGKPQMSNCDRLKDLYREMPAIINAAVEDLCPASASPQCTLMGQFVLEGTRQNIVDIRKLESCTGNQISEDDVTEMCMAIKNAPYEGVKLMKMLFAAGPTHSIAHKLSSRVKKEMAAELKPVYFSHNCEDL